MAETPEKESQAETLNKETQLDKEPVALNTRSSRVPAIVVSSLALAVIGAAGIYALPEFNIALPNFSSFAELFPRETASIPIPDPAVSATLKDIQSAQQQNVAALQENAAILAAKRSYVAARRNYFGVPPARLHCSTDESENNIQSTLLANCASGLRTKCGDAAHDVLHNAAKRSRPLGQNVAQKNISTA